jgi:multiple sugar transport system ATP-binding protein
MADVKLSNVSKSFGSNLILRQIDLEIIDGEFMVFVGPSGCGKSTLLRVIAGLEDISEGELTINGKRVNDLPPSERGIAMVFQSYALYPHMDLYDNMAFGLKLAKLPKAEIDQAVHQAARILNIEHLLSRKPKDLSGGQRQRVAIGRAIVRKPEVFLFDEPLSNLDTALRVRMRYEFAKLHEEFKTTMVYVTHDQVEAMTLADRIVVLSAGRIEQVGSPMTLYEHPDNLFVARFIGSPGMNLLQGELLQASSQGAQVRLTGGELIECRVDASKARTGDTVTVGVRPEDFGIGAGNNTLRTEVTFVESLGSITYAYCSHPASGEVLTVAVERQARARPGDSLLLNVAPEGAHLFDAQGRAFRRLLSQEQSRAA